MSRFLTRFFVLALVCAAAASRTQTAPTVFINEIHYDNTGTDTGEFVEIAGPAGTSLTGYSIVLYNGTGGAVYDTDALAGTIPDQQNGFGTVSLSYPSNGIQNGSPDGIALVQGTTVIQFLSYEGSFTAVGGPANGMVSTDIGVAENGSEPIGQSLRLFGTGSTYSDFTWATPAAATPGAINPDQTFTGTVNPSIAINNFTVTEGDSGTVNAMFTVTITGAHTGVTFDIATSDGTGANPATVADADYVPQSINGVSIPSGTDTYAFTVVVNGDTTFELNEEFLVTLSNVSGADVGDGQGVGTISNDDPAPPVASDVVISQVYGGGGNTGATLTNDFIELFNRGTSVISLAGWSVQYASAGGSSWSVTPLTGSIAPGGYYLVQEAAGTGGTTPLPAPDASGSIALSATNGRVALRDTAAPLPTGSCPPASDVRDFVGYGTATCFEGAGPAAATNNTTAALRKRFGCHDSNNNQGDFLIGSPSPRNSATPTKSCTPMPAAIHDIQGNGLVSPLVDQIVLTSGVVTALKTNGFFLQTPDGAEDPDPMTSQGIFVFTSSSPFVAVGSQVPVRGAVGEFFGLTQIESSLPGDIGAPSPGSVPLPVTLTPGILDPGGTVDQLEPFEGMRLFAASLTSVAPTNEFGEIATVLTGVARPMREPGISVLEPVPPDPTSGTPDCCIPRFDENPERLWIDSEGLAGAAFLGVTSNVVLANVTGPLDFTFGAYKLLPETAPAASPNMSGVPVPVPQPDEFTVGSFNIENFAGNETRKKKAALAIRQLMRSPDVIGHIEILDEATLQSLADQVNADAVAALQPNPGYQAVLIPAPAGGTQNVGFLVKTSRVQIDAVSQERAGDTFINPNTGNPETLHDRPPLVLQATVDPAGLNPREVIVVVNHPRSFIDIELVTGEGPRVRAKRKAQAESIAGLFQQLQTDFPGRAVIAVGDYNAYQFNDGYTDPIATLLGAPTPDNQMVVDESPDVVNPNFVNLTDSLPADQRYSFIFEGTPQVLDHVLVNAVANSYVQRYAIARGNADFPEVPASLFVNDVTRPERASDHDMPVAYFRFPPPSADLALHVSGPPSVPAGQTVTFTYRVTNNGPQPAQNVIVVAGAATIATIPLLAPGETQTFTAVSAVGCDVPAGSVLVNVVTATSTTPDPDPANNSSTVTVTVVNPAPAIGTVTASHTQLWPANHKMVDVALSYTVSDSCGAVTTTVAVSSNEPLNGTGDGDTAPDWEVVNDHLVRLRAERAGAGTGRIYTITITATDAAGGVSQSSLQVIVPHQNE